MGDLGYQGIQHSCPAILPIKRRPRQPLTPAEKRTNRKISRIRVLVENYFGRWKALFAIIAGEYRGDLTRLQWIVTITLGMTNWYLERHPLRRRNTEEEEERGESSDGEESSDDEESDSD
jgi:hypothetical protein